MKYLLIIQDTVLEDKTLWMVPRLETMPVKKHILHTLVLSGKSHSVSKAKYSDSLFYPKLGEKYTPPNPLFSCHAGVTKLVGSVSPYLSHRRCLILQAIYSISFGSSSPQQWKCCRKVFITVFAYKYCRYSKFTLLAWLVFSLNYSSVP